MGPHGQIIVGLPVTRPRILYPLVPGLHDAGLCVCMHAPLAFAGMADGVQTNQFTVSLSEGGGPMTLMARPRPSVLGGTGVLQCTGQHPFVFSSRNVVQRA